MNRRKGYGDMMSRCGHDVDYFEIWKKDHKNKLKPEHIKQMNPDIVWFFNPIYIRNNPQAVDVIRARKIPIVLYNTYMPNEPYEQSMDIWEKIDFLFVHNLELHEFLVGKGIDAHYMPIGFYPYQYFTGGVELDNKYDVSFCGTALPRDSYEDDKRAKYLRALKKEDIVVFGESFLGKVKDIPVKGYSTHEEQRNIYWRSRINLDLPFFHSSPSFYKNKYHIKNRFFEIPASYGFLLTVKCPEFLKIFGEDEIGYYEDSVESLKENVERYLKDEKKRRGMAERSYQIVHQKHTYLHRFEAMFRIIENKETVSI